MPYTPVHQTIRSATYRWNCWDRGDRSFVILQWTHSGEGIFETEGKSLRVPRNHAFVAVIPERSSYYYPAGATEPWSFSWLNFYGGLACQLFRLFRAKFGSVIPLSPKGNASLALQRMISSADQSSTFGRSSLSLQIYSFLLEWWNEASHPSSEPIDGLTRALNFCHERFTEPFGVKQLAVEARMSREHFTRTFLKRIGESPSVFLRNMRIKEAAKLLRETQLPLGEVAMRSGFYSTHHLIRNFQRVHPAGPTAFRNKSEAFDSTKRDPHAREPKMGKLQ